jgi:hypothetical protein
LNADGRFAIEGRGKNVQLRVRVPAADIGASGSGWAAQYGIDHVVGSGGGPK